jgi:CYTH domain-containing protein/predicted ATPase
MLGSNIAAVVVTGGPCGGKSTFLAGARRLLEDRGCRVAVVPEAARELILAGFHPAGPWTGDDAFQRQVFRYLVERRERYVRLMEAVDTVRPKVLLFDRAELDARGAYIEAERFDAILKEAGETPAGIWQRYDAVLHLVTAADGAADHYVRDEARDESPAEARRVDACIKVAWAGHPHRLLVDNGTDFEAKKRRALQFLARVLHMPEPQEIERKWVVLEEGFELPDDAVTAEITQTYLKGPSGVERRVRLRVVDGAASYYYTEKSPTYRREVRVERERLVSEDEYRALLADAVGAPIRKSRTAFTFAGRVMELDRYRDSLAPLVTLEVELPTPDELVELPPGRYREVTQDPRYRNAALATLGLGGLDFIPSVA